MQACVGVVDYEAGNSPSVLRALGHLGIPSVPVSEPHQLKGCTHAVLPGVGSAAATMGSLRTSGMAEALTQHVESGLAFVGICIGLQVLFEHSEEGDTDCLGWLAGSVRRLPPTVRVPQIGWNRVRPAPAAAARSGPALAEALDGYFYFVNSYVAEPAGREVVVAEAEHGGVFPAAVCYENLFATQFHLEKSGAAGLELMRVALATTADCPC